jgi:hypothetical protein
VGSSATGEHLSSTAPEVATVHGTSLVAHRTGRAEIRSLDDPHPLVVTVLAFDALRFEQPQLVLGAGATLRAPLFGTAAGSGSSVQPGQAAAAPAGKSELPVPSEAIRWTFTDTEIARAEGDTILAGHKPGLTRLIAEAGGQTAELTVVVQGAATLNFASSVKQLHRGAVHQVVLDVPAGARVDWSSSAPTVLRSLGGGVFFAVAKGKAKACARALGKDACVPLEVN